MKFKRISKEEDKLLKNIQQRQRLEGELTAFNNRRSLTARELDNKQGIQNKLKQLEREYRNLSK